MFNAYSAHSAGENLAFFGDVTGAFFSVLGGAVTVFLHLFYESDVIDFVNLVHAERTNFLFGRALSLRASRSCFFLIHFNKLLLILER